MKSFSIFGILTVLSVTMTSVAADLSDEQIDQEISRMEKQAAHARSAGKTLSETALPPIAPLSTEAFPEVNKSVDPAATPAVTEPASAAETATAASKAENEIPVFSENKKTTKDKDSDNLSRLSLTVGVLALLGLSSIFFIRRYTQSRREKAKHTQIKVLTQHYLGPKKSLTIVRVAGESLLLGVTDSSITLIKNLALIDDEFPEEIPQNFQNQIAERSVAERTVMELSEGEVEAEIEDSEEEFKMGSLIPRSSPQSGSRRWLT